MQYTWRAELQEYLKDYFVHSPNEWYETSILPDGEVGITVVSARFVGMPFSQREAQIQHILNHLNIAVTTDFLTLYTPQEAMSMELPRTSALETNPHTIFSWLDLAYWAANATEEAVELARQQRILHTPSTIAFYSYKGGVGRTTALLQTASILARRGYTVAAVDLDLESPGLSSALDLAIPSSYGIADYFYERYLKANGEKNVEIEDTEEEVRVAITDIISEIPLVNTSGRLFAVPAGKLGLNYLCIIDDLKINIANYSHDPLWTTFYQEITELLHPDIILVDAQAGFSKWAEFSLLRVADQALVFISPNNQNLFGVRVLTNALAGRLPTYLVFSPVPFEGDAGLDKVKQQWEDLQLEQHAPIIIPSIPTLVLADRLPQEEALSYYVPVADIIDESIAMENRSRRPA